MGSLAAWSLLGLHRHPRSSLSQVLSPITACHGLMILPLCNPNPPFSVETPLSTRVRRRQWYLNTCLYLGRGGPWGFKAAGNNGREK